MSAQSVETKQIIAIGQTLDCFDPRGRITGIKDGMRLVIDAPGGYRRFTLVTEIKVGDVTLPDGLVIKRFEDSPDEHLIPILDNTNSAKPFSNKSLA